MHVGVHTAVLAGDRDDCGRLVPDGLGGIWDVQGLGERIWCRTLAVLGTVDENDEFAGAEVVEFLGHINLLGRAATIAPHAPAVAAPAVCAVVPLIDAERGPVQDEHLPRAVLQGQGVGVELARDADAEDPGTVLRPRIEGHHR